MAAAAQTQQVSSSDFVKKLFKMLEDTTYQHVVRWSDMGDSFIVLDNNEFTKSVLPRHFKHSNFASFVRQLNKYDFHKVRNNEEGGVNPYGDGAWEFKHRDFQVHNKDLLDNIKRKAPAAKKPQQQPVDASASQINNLQTQIESLTRYQRGLSDHLQGLSQQYQTVVSKMLKFQRTLSTQDNVMQNIIQYIVNPETNGPRETSFLPSEQAQKLISSYDEAAKASVDIMNDLSQLGASLAPNSLIPPKNGHQNIPQQQSLQHPAHLQDQPYSRTQSSPSYSVKSVKSDAVKQEYHTPSRDGNSSSATTPDSNAGRPSQRPHPPPQVDTSSHDDFNTFNNFQFPPEQPAGDSQNTGGLRVYTLGHFAPRQEDGEEEPENPSFQPTPANMHVVKDTDDRSAHTLKVRRQTFVPGWAVPPKILLVDDDVVYRNMSSKFLQVFGCEADVAVDGFSALDKVNVEKYDLILMDVVMPNLDGVTTTGMIRQFDSATPIISMTSNIKSNDIMHYFNSGSTLLRCCLTTGMNDVLPKPFTKDSLLGMLEKHLLHMKQMQQMQQLGYPAGPTSIAPQTNSQRVVELSPKDQQNSSPLQHQALDDTLNLEDPNLQFAYNPNFNILFETPTSTTSYPRSQQLPLTSAKRRTASDMDAYEYHDHSINVPRSTGNMNTSNGKRPRYNTPPY